MVQTNILSRIKYLIIGFLCLNLLLKFFAIGSTPPGATYDEIIYAAEAQSIVAYGTDLTGNWRPWHLEPSDAFYTELTSTMLVPGFILFPNNPVLASKFIPLLLGSLLPVLLALIAYKLKKDPLVFITTATIATLNPWIFQFSRMGYDSLFSVVFYSLAIVLVLYQQKWRKLWALIPLFLGFFQYQGHKPLLVPLIGISFLYVVFDAYSWSSIKSTFSQLLKNTNVISSFILVLFSLLLTVTYMVRLPHLTSGERISEFSFYDETVLATEVNTRRRLTLNSPLTPLFVNKYTVLAEDLSERFLNSFNTKRLFISGDRAVDTFTVLDYGYFHLIDILVVSISLLFLFTKKRDYKMVIFIAVFIVIGTVPNVIRTGLPWIIFRGAFTFLGMILLMGIGFTQFLKTLKPRVRTLVIFIYLGATLPFFFIYFFRYPITHTTHTGFYERIVASYAERVAKDTELLIIPDRADATFDYLITYNHLLTAKNKEQVMAAAQTKNFEINSITLLSNCPKSISEVANNTTTFVHLTKTPCEPPTDSDKVTEIKSLIDSGTIFVLYNDALCSQFDLQSYPSVKKNTFAVEKMSDEAFCKTFFSKH